MKTLVMLVGVGAMVASLVTGSARASLRPAPAPAVAGEAFSPACTGDVRMQIALAAIATAP